MFERIGRQILNLKARGMHIVLVSSAAITAGMATAGLLTRPSRQTLMPELQRLASIGWRQVLNAWSQALPGQIVGELLLTQHELQLNNERSELLRVTYALLGHGDIVIANENDAIAHEEIAVGDNDKLAALFATQLQRSKLYGNVRLVLLSDVDGLYADKEDSGTLIRVVDDVSSQEHIAGDAGSANGTGGMKTKLAAANLANQSGMTMWIANGRTDNAIEQVLNGQIGTEFRCQKPSK